MSDLINFNSTNEKVISLASPLIPPPEDSNADNFVDVGANADNPFDLVIQKVEEFEKNKEDPFETVCHKAMGCYGKMLVESEDNFMLKQKSDKIFNESKLCIKKEVEPPIKMGKDTDFMLGLNIKLEKDDEFENENLVSENCDNYNSPYIKVSDLSILSNSSMNDSLLELNDKKDVKKYDLDFKFRHKSETNFLAPRDPFSVRGSRRSLSVTETSKNSILKENSINFSSGYSFDDARNKAFRKSSVGSSSTFMNSDCCNSFLSNSQFDMSLNKQQSERFNSDSSVFSSLSNISSIHSDLSNKQRKEKCSNNSASLSSISSLSMIPYNNTSKYSSTFSNDTLNKGFINSKVHLNSTNMSPSKSEETEKFYEIKSRILGEVPKFNSMDDIESIKENIDPRRSINSVLEKTEKSNERLVDIDDTYNSVFSVSYFLFNVIYF